MESVTDQWREVPDDPPDDRPELSAGASTSDRLALHEAGKPTAWASAGEWLVAPDYVPPEERDRDQKETDG